MDDFHVKEGLMELCWPLEVKEEGKRFIKLDIEGSYISKSDLK